MYNKSFLEGKKTWIGLIITVIGMTGASQYVTGDQLADILDKFFSIAGIVMAVYGNWHAHQKIETLEDMV